MKTKLLLAFLATGLVALATSSPANAQPYRAVPYRPTRPALSPYLDIVRGGSPAINYYLGTRPEMERRAADQALRQVEQDLFGRPPPAVEELEEPRLPATGHATYFNNTGQYFPSGAGYGPAPRSSPAARPRR